MASTVEIVERYLEGDMVLERALSRDLLNVRRTSRWLIDLNCWDTTEEAVVSALRRYDPPESAASIEEGFQLLREGATRLDTSFSVARVSNGRNRRKRLDDVLKNFSEDEPDSILSGPHHASFVLSEATGRYLQSTLPDSYDALFIPVSRVGIEFPEDTPGKNVALSILLETFNQRRIPLVESFSSDRVCCFLAPAEYTSKASDILLHLRGLTPPRD